MAQVKGAYSTDPVYDRLLYRLGELAGLWRETKSEEVVHRYQAVYIALAELGFDEELDIESLIPDQHMPQEYFERIERINVAYRQEHPEKVAK